MCTNNRDDRKLENTVKESRFKHLEELHKEWTEAGVHQESPRSDTFRKRATKTLLKQKHHQKHLTWAKDKKNWTFGNQSPRVWRKSGEAQNPCCLKSSVIFPQSVMIWAAMSSAGFGPLCFLKSTVNAAIYQEILEHFMLPSADKLYGDPDFSFQQDLAPAHTVKDTKSWFNGRFSTVGPVRASALKGPGGANSLGPVAPSPKSWCVSTVGRLTMLLLCLIGQQTGLAWTP